MSNKVRISFKNTMPNNVMIFMEPEGTGLLVKSGELLNLEVLDNEDSIIEIEVSESNAFGTHLVIRPEKGFCLPE